MNRYEYIKKLLIMAYKNTLCLNNDFRIKHAKDSVLLWIKEKNKKLYTQKTINYIRDFKF